MGQRPFGKVITDANNTGEHTMHARRAANKARRVQLVSYKQEQVALEVLLNRCGAFERVLFGDKIYCLGFYLSNAEHLERF